MIPTNNNTIPTNRVISMLIEVTHTPVTEKGREIVQGASSDYPYTAMIVDLNQYDGHATPWCWHEHYEVGFVVRGTVTLCTQR